MTVLIVGATGVVGPHVVDSLLAKGEPVRVLARGPERARALLPEGVDVVGGDPGSEADLSAAAEGAHSLFLLTPHDPGLTDLQLRVVRVLRRTGVRIVKLSGTGSAITPDGPLTCRQHWEVEQVLAASGQPHVVLRPNAFMQTLIDRIMLPAVQATGRIPNALGTAGISLIDARDIGACAAEALTDTRWDGRTLVLTGPRSVTFKEIAVLVGERTGRPVDTVEVTPADVRRGLLERGAEPWEAEHFEEMYGLFREGRSEFVGDDVEHVLGRRPRTVEDYIAALPGLAETTGDPA
ncbi:NmrA family NAD(P)-binding protein [Nocardiopsis protaetiae]|uniref:NmrA family NAD(P)-binding protein n=1 Tax=Nocardiopsis protaetiae TaxID=3382270 RepID=UPI00387A958E